MVYGGTIVGGAWRSVGGVVGVAFSTKCDFGQTARSQGIFATSQAISTKIGVEAIAWL